MEVGWVICSEVEEPVRLLGPMHSEKDPSTSLEDLAAGLKEDLVLDSFEEHGRKIMEKAKAKPKTAAYWFSEIFGTLLLPLGLVIVMPLLILGAWTRICEVVRKKFAHIILGDRP